MNTQPSLSQAIIHYSKAIHAIKASDPKLSLEQLLEVLYARDQVENTLTSDKSNTSAQTLTQLVELDLQLKDLSKSIGNNSHIENCRDSLNPPQTSWWWFLSSPKPLPTKSPRLASFNWMWNSLTVLCLVLSGTFMTHTIKAFSKNGLDLLQTFSAAAQGAGLALVTGGTLTDKGKKFTENALNSINVPAVYHPEVTFALSAAVLLAAYGVNRSLPDLGQYYYSQGQKFYDKGQLDKAQESLTQAQGFAPDDFRISSALGNIHETLGNQEQAKSMYQIGVTGGNPMSLNGMGRVLLRQASSYDDLLQSEAMFRIALDQPQIPTDLKAELYGHLGFTLIKQTETEDVPPNKILFLQNEAAQILEKGIDVDRTIIQNRSPGLGLSYCYLAILLQQQNNTSEASEQWNSCITYALPTSIDEYRDIGHYAKPEIFKQINTSEIIRN
ncbi:MAG: tetratricopeptide repeat protein [Cyanobacteria bacterium P01_F01_bin.143]